MSHFVVWRYTAAKRMRAKLRDIKQESNRMMHEPAAYGPEIGSHNLEHSGRFTIVVVQQSTNTFMAPHDAAFAKVIPLRADNLVREALMVPFRVVNA